MLPRLFETFSQADRSLDRTSGGLGLGLSLVKGLVELHGGRIDVKSAGLGHGAEFTVLLPREEEPLALTDKPLPARPRPIEKRLRVLVVEDNRDAADSLRILLELLGYDVAVAYTGPEGLAAAKRDQPDVVVCDIGLPGMDGFALASALRKNGRMARARLIAVTGYGEEEDKRRAVEAGFDDHLVKTGRSRKTSRQAETCWNGKLIF
jgi:CheY-like chemotaxis protein